MCDEKWGAVAVACDDGDPEENRPQTAAEAAKLWRKWRYNGSLEAERMRHCCGCQWLKQCGTNLYCSHLLATDKRRGCPPGSSCERKQTPPGWKYPRGYKEWCADLDRQYGRLNVKKKKKTPFALVFARELYEAEYATLDISEITGLTTGVIQYHAQTEKWHDGHRKKIRKTGRDLTGEKEAFRRRKEQYERDDSDTE